MTAVLLSLLVLLVGQAHGALKLASYYADHMVLQRGPQQAVLWGTADTEGDTVTAQVTGQGSPVTTTVHSGSWKLKLPAVTDPGPFTLTVKSSDGQVTLNDVLFGDVWLCSGQSNMEFELKKVSNSSSELQKALDFQTVRFMKTAYSRSDTPLTDLEYLGQQWTAPTADTVKDFSALCFLFAEYLQPHLKYPIGLVGSYWGGTTVETWSPPEAISVCPTVSHGTEPSCCPHRPLTLWNSKIYPLRPMTIKGALWYQGESNADHTAEYSCQMQALINQWRTQFNRESLGQTPADFPFGYMQLAAFNPGNLVGGFPDLRWAQTARHGFSPNTDQSNTFMAVAMDLPDFTSPYGSIHPRFKQDMARRLVPGALNVAYGQRNVSFQGPFPSKFIPDNAAHILTIEYNTGRVNLDIKNANGFEVCCRQNQQMCNVFTALVLAPIVSHAGSRVTIDVSGCGSQGVVTVRYAWRTSPCDFKQCAIYDATSGLPAPPFSLPVSSTGHVIG